MAIAFHTSADLGNNGGSGNLTVAYTVNAASNFLVVNAVGSTTTQNITGITYNGVSMTIGKVLGVTDQRFGWLFYLFNPATGTNNIVATTNSADWVILGASDYSGLGSVESVLDQTLPTNITTATSTVTTTTTGDWILEGTSNSTTTPSAGTGLTQRSVQAGTGVWILADSNGPVTVGSNSVTVNFSPAVAASEAWVMVASPSVGGAAGCQNRLLLAGIGCGIAAKKLEENPVISRRGLILPGEFNG